MSPPSAFEPIDPAPWLALLEERFGIAPGTFDGYVLFRTSRKYISIRPVSHLPPARPRPQSVGLTFLKTSLRFPKLTTQAAMTFGHAASRNVVTLGRTAAAAYLQRTPVPVTPDVLPDGNGLGYVLVRHAGLTLGLGLFKPEAGREDRGVLESLFPKYWAGLQDLDLT
jgi:hypothetical protein